ncbi:putative disease resistance RPP13-like protein 1 isoform X2 [Actinidia eriantha]|nr:putative disease resistance RPP13-like protein 1 isoform X2 [Actinidia eriantha]XP_057513353.1 putative disease resistance RPP13-like protein 1 isoform X2 [Actinidia eriantha]
MKSFENLIMKVHGHTMHYLSFLRAIIWLNTLVLCSPVLIPEEETMTVGEIFLAASITVLLEKLASGELSNFVRREGIHTALEKWTRMLKEIEAVLADAEEKQINEGLIQNWLEDLQDLAYDLDDVLDEIATEALRRKLKHQERLASIRKVSAFIPACLRPSTVLSDFRMKSKLDKITPRLQDLFERRSGFGLQRVAAVASASGSQGRETSSIHEPFVVHGRVEDKKAIMEFLLNDQLSNTKFGVVPIVGMGGVGKTTLARMVYNDKTVEEHFDIKAWVCVSDNFDIMRVTKAILESVAPPPRDLKELDQVQVELKKGLTGKKFLIVLDDVWNENPGDWIKLKSPFIDGAQGSKVIVTTRDRHVADMMGTVKYHDLKQLSDADCWFVFEQHAFENLSTDGCPDLVSIGRKIVAKCGGLPLAARTLGGLLRCKSRNDEWEDVLNSKMWELRDNKSDILPALRLSYWHLPAYLKKCFAYCSILPNDYEFEEKELVLLWMAEGFIQQPKGEKQIEDLGCEYFRELLARSFFQSSSSGERSLFVMHDLINDLAQYVARRICFRLEDNLENKDIRKVRHFSYMRNHFDGIKKLETFCEAKNLRTFLPCGSRDQWSYCYLTSKVPLDLLPKLRCLRVLSMRSYCIGQLSSKLGNLKHVRYLDLSKALIKRLPESLGTLYNLQTLILKDCRNLEKLPRGMGNLIKLRHLDITGANSLQEMSSKMGKLTNLQTLSNYIISKGDGPMIRELGTLIHLRGTLCISGLENVVDVADAIGANLHDKQGIDVLSMKWRWSNSSDDSRKESVELEVLEMLQPSKNLKKLTISSYHGLRFPTWVGDPLFSNMVRLKLESCNKCAFLPPLGLLPKLAELHIQWMKVVENVGLEFYGRGYSNPFPSLEILSFENMPEWKEWSPFGVDAEAQVFARLSELSITSCPKLLGKLPSNLPLLKKLEIRECPQLMIEGLPSPTMPHGMRNTLPFDSLTSLSLSDVSIPCSFNSPEVADEACSPSSSLTSMSLENIKELKCLPSWFLQGMMGLQELKIHDCENLTILWQNDVRLQHRLPALRSLEIKKCPQLISLFEEEKEGQQQQYEGLPRGLPSTLRTLQINSCDSLQSLPELMMLNDLEKLEVWNCSALTCLCPGAGLSSTLKKLSIYHCKKLEAVLAEGMTINCPSLESLYISSCDNLKTLPNVIQNHDLRNLNRLFIKDCDNLESLPEGWFLTTNLRELGIEGCKKLDALPQSAYNNLTSLQRLDIGSSPAAAGIASYVLKEGCSLTNLTTLSISNIDKPPSEWGLHRLASLRELRLEDYSWVSFPEDGFSLPTSLISIWIVRFPNLEKLSSKVLQTLTSLKQFYMMDCPTVTSIAELGLLTSLSTLFIQGCPNLASIAGLGLLPSLLELWISDCPNLASFPDQGLPLSLLKLEINRCPILSQRCEKKKGQYWPFIAHIPCVEIDDRFN